MSRHRDTEALHVGEGADPTARPLNTPVYTSTTFAFPTAAAIEAYLDGGPGFFYSRYANPSVAAVEAKLAAIEGAEAALVTSSGMAATATALFALLDPGDELVCSGVLYGGTLRLATTMLRRFGVVVRLVAPDAFARPGDLIGPRTRLVWFESPSNPTLRCVAIRPVADACRARGVCSVLDSTFASPINQQPLAHGVDLVMHSATKYLNGHSDVSAGVLAGARDLIDRLEAARRLFGGVLDPDAATRLARGLRTLGVRVARQNASALALATRLEADPRVARVYYPGLASHPDHAVAAAQMAGFGGMICLDLAGGLDAARAAFDTFTLITRAVSLGGVETLCSLPVLTSHHGIAAEDLARAGVTPGMLRLSVGLEHVDDLWADLDRALAAAG